MNYNGQEFSSIIQNVFGDVKGYGPQFSVNCPRCQEKDGLPYPDGKFNLEINTSKRGGIFHCWRCDEPRFSGSLSRLIKMYGNSSDYETYKSYAAIYHDYSDDEYEHEEAEPVDIQLPAKMVLFSQMELDNPDHFEAYNYMVNERKISREIMFKYRLGFCTTGKYAKRIIIPSYDTNGEISYFVARTYDPKEKKLKYLNPKVDKNKIIFNEGLINWDSLVFIVEGVFDMFRLPNSIPLLGKDISETLYFELKKHKPKIIVVLDPDAWKNEIDNYYTLNLIYDNDDNVRILHLNGNYDIDEINKNLGHDEIIELLYNARRLNNDDYFDRNLVNEKKNFRNFYC
jgi:DNA primase